MCRHLTPRKHKQLLAAATPIPVARQTIPPTTRVIRVLCFLFQMERRFSLVHTCVLKQQHFIRLLLLLLIATIPHGHSWEPEFAEPMKNVTVAIGRQALLSCVVNNLGIYKVAWVKVNTKTILSIHRNVITRNYRITTSHTDDKFWHLHIKNIQESDRGLYMCQINTIPVKSQTGYLDVVFPPNILDSETSTDVVVKEGDNVNLTCKAEGHPQPLIIWRREDGHPIQQKYSDVETVDGEILSLSRINRLHMAAYLCIASNGVPPSVSKRIILQVHFSPHTWIPNQLVGGYVGGDVILECNTEAFPKSINYWTTEEGDMISSGDKYESIVRDDVFRVFMKLKIRNLEKKDFGVYRCIARNFLGETDGTVNLYEIPAPSTRPTTTVEKLNIIIEAKDHMGGEGGHGTINDGDGSPADGDNSYSINNGIVEAEGSPLYGNSKQGPHANDSNSSNYSSGLDWLQLLLTSMCWVVFL